MKKRLFLIMCSVLVIQSAQPMNMIQTQFKPIKPIITIQNNLKTAAQIMVLFAERDPRQIDIAINKEGVQTLQPGEFSTLAVRMPKQEVRQRPVRISISQDTETMRPYLVWSSDPNFPDKEPYKVIASMYTNYISPGNNQNIRFVEIHQTGIQKITLQEESTEGN